MTHEEERTITLQEIRRDPNLGPTTSALNVGATATGSPAAIPRERLFQRVWLPMMIGVTFVLEVAWIVFLVYSSIALVR